MRDSIDEIIASLSESDKYRIIRQEIMKKIINYGYEHPLNSTNEER